MKTILLPILALFAGIISFGQNENEFVEVVVTDTTLIEPEEFIYAVYCNNHIYFSDTTVSENDDLVVPLKNPGQSCIEKVRTIIVRMKLDTVSKINYSIQSVNYGYNQEKAITIIEKSRKKLDAFVTEVRKIEDVSGIITNVTSSKVSEIENGLMVRLLKKAHEKAIVIAKESKKQLGKLLSVQEADDENAGGWTMYPPLSFTVRSDANDVSDKIILIKRLIVRYAWQ